MTTVLVADTTTNNNNNNNHHSTTNRTDDLMMMMDEMDVTKFIDEMKEQLVQQQSFRNIQNEKVVTLQKCQQIYNANLLSIPTSMKHMKIKDFNKLYQCDVLKEIQFVPQQPNVTTGGSSSSSSVSSTNHFKSSMNSTLGVPSSSSSSLATASAVFSTPHPKNSSMSTLFKGGSKYHGSTTSTFGKGPYQQTPFQTIRKVRDVGVGDLVATVVKKKTKDNNNSNSTQALCRTEMGISVGDGTIVPLNDEQCLNELTIEEKMNALDQVTVLQEQLAKIVNILQK